MRAICLSSIVLAVLMPLSAMAEGSSCTASATDKKLAGAAKNSFMKKCEADAQAKQLAAHKLQYNQLRSRESTAFQNFRSGKKVALK